MNNKIKNRENCIQMKMPPRFQLSLNIFALCFGLFFINEDIQAQSLEPDKPILTIGAISDIHNQESLINTSINNIKLRGVFETTLDRMKTEDNPDILIFNGDFTSDVTISEAQYNRVRELIAEAGRNMFYPELSRKPVFYVLGNHDYEVANFDYLPKSYNAGEYYSQLMKTDIGELNAQSVFYELASNGALPAMNLLAAYHYVVEGFDFVALNAGKYFFSNAWDYTYSEESVTWVKNKLAEIYAGNPNKTVFFLCHIPFNDSKGISDSNKGIFDNAATQLLRETLAKYPNLIYCYGHDHGTNSAFIRTSTDERITRYDSNGNIFNENSNTGEPKTLFYIQNKAENTYLGANTYNLYPVTTPTICTITPNSTDNYFNIRVSAPQITTPSSNGLHCGGSGRFSLNAIPANIRLFCVTSTSGATVTAEQVTDGVVLHGGEYLIVGNTTDAGGASYAVTNEPYSANTSSQRVVGSPVSINGTTLTYTDSNTNDSYSALWTFNDIEEPQATNSFISSFVGSMRYYNNSIDGSVGVNNSRIVQALMIYVYNDSIVLKMKNYGESGTINGITVNEDLKPYILIRSVEGAKPAAPRQVTVSVVSNQLDAGSVNILSPENEVTTVNTTEPVIVQASGHESSQFLKWINVDTDETISFANPYRYAGLDAIHLAAVFTIDPMNITDSTRSKLKVYPNPTSGELRVENKNENEICELFDVMGRNVRFFSLCVSSSEMTIDISRLPTGVYFLRIGNETVKIIKILE